MKRLAKFLLLILAALVSSAWLVRLGMQSIIRLPVSDSMIQVALTFYRPGDQEESTNLLAVLGFLVWLPATALLWWASLKLGDRHRRNPA